MDLYIKGNALYTSNDIHGAVQAYIAALDISDIQKDIRLKVLLNKAQCFLKLEQYNEAVAECSQAIHEITSIIGTKPYDLLIKALMRRVQAHEALGNFVKALNDIEEVLRMNSPTNICKIALVIRSRLKEFVKNDTEIAHLEGRPNTMVTSQQALRLCFIQQPPTTFINGQAYLIRLCITNELGLWDRNLLTNTSNEYMPSLQCAPMTISSSSAAARVTEYSDGTLNNLNNTEEGKQHECFTLDIIPVNKKKVDDLSLNIGEDGKVDIWVTVHINSKSISLIEEVSTKLLMLRFSLDRSLPSCGEVLPVLSLPARIRPTTGTGCTGMGSVDKSTSNDTYEEVQRLCLNVHATCVREIAVSLGHSNAATDTHTTCSEAEVVHAPAIAAEGDIAAVTTPVSSTMSSFNVYALESPGYLGIAGKVWDSMYVLLQYLSQHTGRLVRGKRIVELGCGTGLAGISLCALEPLNVTLTDMVEVVPLISANVLLNSLLVQDVYIQAVLRERYRAEEYIWGEALGGCTSSAVSSVCTHSISTSKNDISYIGNNHPYFDVILASDVVYYPEGYVPLITTLCDLLCAKDPVTEAAGSTNPAADASCAAYPICILAHRHRHPEDKKFFDALYAAPQLQVKRLEFQAEHQGEASSVTALNDVLLFEITRR